MSAATAPTTRAATRPAAAPATATRPARAPAPAARTASAATRAAGPTTRSAAGAAVAPDLSNPTAAARAYADLVIAGGNPAAVRLVAAGDDRAMEQAEAAATMAAASYDVGAALAARFGKEGEDYAPLRNDDHRQFVARLAQSKAFVEGDLATVYATDANWRLNLKLVRGAWLVVLPEAIRDKELHDRAVRWMRARAGVLYELAAEVRAGRYATVQEFDDARREKTRRLTDTMLQPK